MGDLPPAPWAHPPLSPPRPPPSPLAPEIPHLILGSLRYTLAWDVVASVALLAAWWVWRLDTYWLSRGDGRWRQLWSVWRASGEEVASRCGADARDYLVVQRLLLVAVAVVAVPGVLLLLPVAITLGSDWGDGDDESAFARTTVHHLHDRSPYLWCVALTSAVAVAAVHLVADRVERTLVRERYAAGAELASTVAAVTILLRRLPRRVTDRPAALHAALDARYPGRVHAVVVPRDGRGTRLARRLDDARARLVAARRRVTDGTAARGVANAAARAVAAAEDALARYERHASPPPPGCCFAVFRDVDAANSALRALRPTLRGVLVGVLAGRILPFRVAKRLAPGFRGGAPVPGWSGGEPSSCSSRVEISDPEISDPRDSRRREDSERREAVDSDPRSDSERRESVDSDPRSDSERRESVDSDPRSDPLVPRPAGSRGFGDPGAIASVSLAVGVGAHAWRVDRAPPPSGVLWENVGAASASRLARSVAVDGAVAVGLVFVSSPLAAFGIANEAAKTFAPAADSSAARMSWPAWVAWARGEGAFAGFAFQFLPNLGALVVVYLVIPRVMERATRAERHLTRSGALRSLVTKEFWYFLVNLLLLLALGKAALSAAASRAFECRRGRNPADVPDACGRTFVRVLGESFVASSGVSMCGFLFTCCTLGPAWELLSLLAYARGVAAERSRGGGRRWPRNHRSHIGVGSDGNGNGNGSLRDGEDDERREEPLPGEPRGIPRGTPGPGEPRGTPRGTPSCTPTPDRDDAIVDDGFMRAFSSPAPPPGPSRRRGVPAPPGSSYRPPFDLPGMHAFNATVFACAMVYASLAPALLVPGVAFFAARFLVHKHNLLALHRANVAGASEGEGSDLFGSGRGGVGGGGGRGGDDALGDHSEFPRRNSGVGLDASSADAFAFSADAFGVAEANASERPGSVPSRRTSDGRLVEAVARAIRASAWLHAAVSAAFLNLRGTRAQSACAAATLVVAVGWTRARDALRAWNAASVGRRDATFGEGSSVAPEILLQASQYAGPPRDEGDPLRPVATSTPILRRTRTSSSTPSAQRVPRRLRGVFRGGDEFGDDDDGGNLRTPLLRGSGEET